MLKIVTPFRALMIAGLITSSSSVAQQAGPAPAAQARPLSPRMGTQPQELLLSKITVSDLSRSLDFYTKVVGLKLVTSPDMPLPKPPAAGEPEKDFIEIALNYSGSMADPLFVVMKRRGKAVPREFAGLIDIGFKVPSTAAVMERAKHAGFQPTRPFGGAGQPGFLLDPDGYSVEFIEARSF